MTHADLLALLKAETAEEQDIAGKVHNLLTTVENNSDDVPQDVVDAANELKGAIDTVQATLTPATPGGDPAPTGG